MRAMRERVLSAFAFMPEQVQAFIPLPLTLRRRYTTRVSTRLPGKRSSWRAVSRSEGDSTAFSTKKETAKQNVVFSLTFFGKSTTKTTDAVRTFPGAPVS